LKINSRSFRVVAGGGFEPPRPKAGGYEPPEIPDFSHPAI